MKQLSGWKQTSEKGKKFTRTDKGSGFEKQNPFSPENKAKQNSFKKLACSLHLNPSKVN